MKRILFVGAILCFTATASAALEELGNSCLDKLKAQVENSQAMLVRPAGAAFNSLVRDFQQRTPLAEQKNFVSTEYSVNFPEGSDQSTDLLKRTKYKNGDAYRDLSITISQGRSISHAYKLEVQEGLFNMGAEEGFTIDQQFDISQGCEVRLFNTTVSVKKIKNGAVTITNQVFTGARPRQGSAVSKLTKPVPTDGFRLFYIYTSKSPEEIGLLTPDIGRHGYNVTDSLQNPFFPLAVSAGAQSLTNPLTGKNEAMKGIELTYEVEGASLKSALLVSADGSSFVHIDPGSSLWLTTQPVWQQTTIVPLSHISETPVELAPNLDTDAEISEISLRSTWNYISYPNLSMYWKDLGVKVKARSTYIMHLKANAPIVYAQVPTDPPLKGLQAHDFLGDSEAVQTTVPEVKALAAEVSGQVPTEQNRLLIAKAISEVLRQHLTYNYDAITAGGDIVEGTTSEIIKNHGGTCQNFANVFVAVARSMGIPARIIAGWYLDEDKATLHSWIEVEAKENLWIPMEPQLAADHIDTGSYLPLAAEPTDTYDDGSVQALMAMPILPTILKTQYFR